jgi:hypothetical protein
MADDLLVIIPTRGRPGSIPEIVQAWDDTGATADVLFCVDKDDAELPAYKVQAKAYATTSGCGSCSGRGNASSAPSTRLR